MLCKHYSFSWERLQRLWIVVSKVLLKLTKEELSLPAPALVKHAASDREPQKCLKPKVILAIPLVPDKHFSPFLFPSILPVCTCTPNKHS